jgi:uncharacterized protein (DUF362 family)
MNRREFLWRGGAAAALAAVSVGTGWYFHNRRLVPPRAGAVHIPPFIIEGTEGELVIVRGQDGAKMVAAALAELGGIERFIKPGDRVIVKPNCAFDRPPHLGATSSPEVVGEVVRQCRAAGAEVRVVDNPINDPEGCFAKSGLGEAVAKAGGTVWLPAAGLFGHTTVGERRITSWEALLTPLKWATKIIGVPTVKSHNLCHASLAMKNWYGLLGGGRNRLHQAIHEVISDLGMFITPTLVVLDGTRLLLTNGPTGGSTADVAPGNVVAVGTDQVAIDTFGAELLGVPPEQIEYLALAEASGVGRRARDELKRSREISI